jgi:hypothetical protein
MNSLSFEQINQIDLVEFLTSIGIDPKKRKGHRYYYCSPLAIHPAHRPTFIVNRHLNRWRETTTKQAGRVADLAVNLYDCTIGELTIHLQAVLPPVPRDNPAASTNHQPVIAVEQVHPIRSSCLQHYLWERRIPLDVARFYCLEAWYTRENKLHHTLAFRNDAGGFELFDKHHHYRVLPSAPTHIRNQSQSIAIFRHVLDLLSFATIFAGPVIKFPDFLILNAPVAFQVVRHILQPYQQKHLFLPNDAAGIAFSSLAATNLKSCRDHRSLYQGYPSLNDWICRIGTGSPPPLYP